MVGESGIGKSAPLGFARTQAEGISVLEARGFESDAELASAGLADLVRPGLRDLGTLPPRRRPRWRAPLRWPRRRRAIASRSARPRLRRACARLGVAVETLILGENDDDLDGGPGHRGDVRRRQRNERRGRLPLTQGHGSRSLRPGDRDLVA